jgi:hypothetical protein
MRAVFNFFGTGLLVASLSGCATSSGVIVNPSARKAVYRSAYVIVHGDRSSDMDANVQKELFSCLRTAPAPPIHTSVRL